MANSAQIETFLTSAAFAVVGASSNRTKFGNRVLRSYLQKGLTVYPVNPHEEKIENLKVYPTIASLPDTIKSISIITPPAVTQKIVEEAIAKGINNIWMQPGAENREAIEMAKKAGLNVIAYGPCVLVEFGV